MPRCVSPIRIKDPRKVKRGSFLDVPCGKCGNCRKRRRNEWTFRIKEELKHSLNAKFITLTYDDENLPYCSQDPTLVKSDLQKFHKRIRKANSVKIRYYAVGEYGTITNRPHYHTIIFNIDNSVVDRMDDYWSLGFVKIGSVTDASIHYVTKYHVNYEPGSKSITKEKEFAVMSRNPGIGFKYLGRTKGWNKQGNRNYVINNGYKQSMPRYYRDRVFSSAEKENMSEKARRDLDKVYKREVERLKRAGVKNPELAKELAERAAAEKVFKDGKGNLF